MSFISNFLEIVTIVDGFGQSIQLRINKQKKSKTIFGGLLTISMIILLVLMFVFNAQDVLYHINPQISLEQQVLSKVNNLTLDMKTFPVGFGLTGNSNFPIYMPNYFKYSAVFYQGSTEAYQLEETYLNVTFCKKENFPKISQEEYDALLMNSSLCIENQQITISGSWTDTYISFLSLQLGICQNTTLKNNCAPYEEIINYLQNEMVFWNIFYQNTNINPQLATNSNTYDLFMIYSSVKVDTHKYIEIYVKQQSLISDDGFMFQTQNLLESISFDYVTTDDGSFDDSKTLSEFYIMISRNVFTYHRVYMKIQTVLANVGGMANILKIFFAILAYLFSIVKQDEIILNKFFEFDFSEKSKDEKLKNIIEEIYPNSLLNKVEGLTQIKVNKTSLDNSASDNLKFNFNNPNHISITTPIINTFAISRPRSSQYSISKGNNVKSLHGPKTKQSILMKDEIRVNTSVNFPVNYISSKVDTPKFNENVDNETKVNITNRRKHFKSPYKTCDAKELIELIESKNKKSELHFTFWEILISFLCCKCCRKNQLKTKKKLYKKSSFVVDELLDITNIIYKLEEFEKFKMIIFNSQQQALFSFISKELMSLDEAKLTNHDMTKSKKTTQDKENLAKIIIDFRNILTNESQVDEIDSKLLSLLNTEFK